MIVPICDHYGMVTSHTVIHSLDWQRALSVLCKTLANKQVDSSDHGVDKEEAVIKEISRAVHVLRALLDTFKLSVAVSVILSLLLISGDIEQNPGPGGNYILRFQCSEAKLGNYTFFNTYYLKNHLHQRLQKLEYWLSMSSCSLG